MTSNEDSVFTSLKRLSRLNVEDLQAAQIVKLKAVDGLNNTQIARALGITPSDVEEAMRRAKHQFQSYISGRTDLKDGDEDKVDGLLVCRHAISGTDQESLKSWIDQKAIWESDYTRLRWWLLYKYVYKKKVLMRGDGFKLPSPLSEMVELALQKNWTSSIAEQATVQKYLVGSEIGAHVDCQKCFPGDIWTISLVKPARLLLKDIWTPMTYETILNPGDVLVLRGDARYFWTHEIRRCAAGLGEDPVSWYRYSITLRNINPDRVRA
jgi:alkylated DNA repair dioxygenase AlkB